MKMGESSSRLKPLSPSFLRVGEENITQDEDLSEKMGNSSKCGCLSAQAARSSLPFCDPQSFLKSINLLEGERHQKLRFTEAQTQHLEATFERQPRPDAPKKRRLAAELGVQVRQVEVWFQNRRARGRSSKRIANKPEQQQQQQQQKVVASEREAFRQRCQELLVHNHQLRSLIQIERLNHNNASALGTLQLQQAICNSCKQVREQL